jgi:pimeloyl-ACP methyl ester carboxylesterase
MTRKRKITLGISATVAVVLLLPPYMFSRMVTNPHKSHPQERFSADWQRVTFQGPDAVQLRGVLRKREDALGTFVICHGQGDSKESQMDKAEFAFNRCYNVLAFDFRGHGESDEALCTLGAKESQDILCAIAYLKGESHLIKPLILWGVSMGAASCLLAAKHSADTDAVIAESSFDSLEGTLAHHGWLYYRLPRFPYAHLTLLFYRLRTGCSPAEVNVLQAVSNSKARRIFLIHSPDDARMPPELGGRLLDAAGEKGLLWIAPRGEHGEIYGASCKEYNEKVQAFLSTLVPSE